MTAPVEGAFTRNDDLNVQVRNNEVWLLRGGKGVQLTQDGRSKVEAVLSKSRDRIAYYEECPEGEGCTPSVIILSLEGRRLESFRPTISAILSPNPEFCGSILGITWLSDVSIGVEGHVNPSVSSYVEMDLKTGKRIRDFAGFGFTRSPDGKWVAHVAPLMHFAPPYAKSYYLQVNDLTGYPLPRNTKPLPEPKFDRDIDVVQEHGDRYTGIHEFVPKFAWSPDSKHVAFVDRVFDWIVTGGPDAGGSPIGEERNRACSIAAVSVTGTNPVKTWIDGSNDRE